MALKTDRKHIDSRIDFFMNETGERGGIVSVSTAGSGGAMDQPSQLCAYTANPSGATPLGLLMNDVVDIDLTRQKLNPYKDEVQKNSKVTIWEKGEVVTNRIQPGVTISAGQAAYLHASGYLTNNIHLDHNGLRVGTWMSTKDEDGYAKVSVNLPRTHK